MQDLRAQVLANNHEVVMGAQAGLMELAKLLQQTVQTPRPLHEVLDNKDNKYSITPLRSLLFNTPPHSDTRGGRMSRGSDACFLERRKA